MNNQDSRTNKIKRMFVIFMLFLLVFMVSMKIKLDKQEKNIHDAFASEVHELQISLINTLVYMRPLEKSEFPEKVNYAIGYKVGILDNILTRGQTIKVYSDHKLNKEIIHSFDELYRYLRGFPTTINWILTEPNIDYDLEIDAINQDLQRVYDFVETVSTTLRDNSNNPSALKELDLYDSVHSLIRQTKSETLKMYFDTISMYYPKYESE